MLTPVHADPRPIAACLLAAALALAASSVGGSASIWLAMGGGAAALLVLLAGRHSALGRWTAAGATLALVGSLLVHDPQRPLQALVLGVLGSVPLLLLFRSERLARLDGSLLGEPRSAGLRDAGLVASLGVLATGTLETMAGQLGSLALVAVPLTIAVTAGRAGPGSRRDRLIVTLLPILAAAFLMGGIVGGDGRRAAFMACAPLLTMSWLASQRTLRGSAPAELTAETLLGSVLSNPARTLVTSFLALGVVGAFLLEMPGASAHAEPIPWIDAAFTAVSATCVTGLATLDTPVAFSGWGELLVLLLIQVGGLGIMVFSAAAFVVLGRRMSLSHEAAAVEMIGAEGRNDLRGALRRVLGVTLATEVLAALLLSWAFWRLGDTPAQALWRGVFTAISAFCNAGFALQSDSLITYAQHPFVLGVVGLTIVVGGLGPAVVAATIQRRRGRPDLHTRIVLFVSLLLIAVPALLFAAFEWNTTLQDLPILHKVTNSIFQSVTLRTAGFNSVDLAAIAPATWSLMLPLMFIGGSPGSTAGGIKTTTFALLVLAASATVRGKTRIELAGRRIPTRLVLRAIALTGASLATVALTTVMLQLGGTMTTELAVFESFSAVGTVGLSVGGTARLDAVGKVVVMIAMFAGRVGPLTLFAAFALSPERSRHRLPNESIPLS